MNVTEDILIVSKKMKAKYVFDQLTFKDVLDLAFKKVGLIRVVQDELSWDYAHFRIKKNNFVTYDGDANNDDEISAHVFPLNQLVKVKNNVVYLKSKDDHPAEIHFFKTTALNFKFDLAQTKGS